jgi:threonine dehydrogenase-like Zn-dependent dehydrogenase
MKAMVLRGTTLTVEDIEKPSPGPGQVLAKVLACGICGSDLHQAKHWKEMMESTARSGGTAFDSANLERGVVMGHEFVAEVVQNAPGESRWSPGTRVTSVPVLPAPETARGMVGIGYSSDHPGGYSEYILMSSEMLLEVPGHVPNKVAATTEPCAVGLHAVRRGEMQPGEHALVVGAGPIGLMTLLWLKKEGVEHVTVSEFAVERRELAQTLGADLVINPAEEDVTEVMTEKAGGPPPVVFEAVGVVGTLQQSMELCAQGGRVVVAGVCMVPDTISPMVGISKQLRVEFVLGYTPEEYAEALGALADGSIDTAPMVTRSVTIDELPATFAALADPTDCKVVVEHRG